jgi:hypothetical protein
MIHYALTCDGGHEFDGWFAGSAAFDAQCAAGLVECPHCATPSVRRALMAPSLGRGAVEVLPAEEPKKPPRPAMPAEMVAALQKLREVVERSCDYVGPNFADQARQMHRGETETRAIYGEALPEEAEALRDEGIEIGLIPWVKRADS